MRGSWKAAWMKVWGADVPIRPCNSFPEFSAALSKYGACNVPEEGGVSFINEVRYARSMATLGGLTLSALFVRVVP